ncbi:zinc ribbon domain-containing protein [Flavobacterium sp. AG291]|uniref:zinc ribbon domain-containing protein n=1 Tax=Flavobacterium sp. AG291 TaxID=2184000 RepID=UPI000E0B0C58|nr:zinc ribbon domain-containing protein [Flavobacterium sp. AG291]RDI14583.1 zinc ribbon protein [Flavobacterium sp. AG291]
MKNVVCQQCDFEQDESHDFCVNCGVKLKCENCNREIVKNAKFCSGCGFPLSDDKFPKSSNTFKLRETANERVIEASFSDNVGKDLAGILKDAYTPRVKGIPINTQNIGNDNIQDETSEEIDYTDINTEDQDVQSKFKRPQSNSINNKFNAGNIEYPALVAIAMKNLPSTDLEWLVVLSFYASKFGEDMFSREEIVEKYKEANKFTKTTTSKLSINIQRAVVAGYINPLASGYSVLDEGKNKAIEILNRQASSSPKIKRVSPTVKHKEQSEEAKSKTKRQSSRSYKLLSDLDFYPDKQESLKDYSAKFTMNSDSEKTLVFMSYLQNILKIQPITYDHLYTCYDELKNKIPENMKSCVSNAQVKGWVKYDKVLGWIVSTKGINKLRNWNN